MLAEGCVSDQTSWVTINDVVTQNAGRRLRVESNVGGVHYRGLGRVTIDVAKCSTSQWTRPTPQAPILIVLSCPVSKRWFAAETQSK